MFGAIYAHELRRALRGPALYINLAVFAAIGFFFVAIACGAIKGGTVDFGTGAKVMVNSPFGLLLLISIVSMFGIVPVAAVAGQATHQDVQHNSTSFFYTAPISKFDYLGGRFCAALTQLAIIFLGSALGAWLSSHVPWPDRSHIGPDMFFAYVQPYAVIVFPNLLLFGAAFFSVVTLTRRMLPAYVAAVLGIVCYQVANQFTASLSLRTLTALFDPFGINAVTVLTQYWTPFERNTQLVPLAGVLLWNRIIWTGLGLALLALTFWRFRMGTPVERSRKTAQIRAEITPALALPQTQRSYSFSAALAQLVSGAWLQFRETVRSVFFVVVALAGFGMTIIALLNSGSDVPEYPLTYIMLEWGRNAFGIFALAIITFYAGELVWRERDAKIDQLVDSQPLSDWVLFGSKAGALLLVGIVLVALIFAAGITAQVSQGYYHFELAQYAHELIANRLVSFWILCALALCVQVLINQKHAGYAVMVLYFIATLALPQAGFQDYLYRFGQTPPYQYSDLNGYGVFAAPLAWFHLYWGIAAVILAIAAAILWVRGTDYTWKVRIRTAAKRLGGGARFAPAVGVLALASTGAFIYYNTHILNAYVTAYQADEHAAQYERLYKRYAALPQPRMARVDDVVDLYPQRREARIRGTVVLRNTGHEPLSRIIVTQSMWNGRPARAGHFGLQSVVFDRAASSVIADDDRGFYLYRLARPLSPGGTISMRFTSDYQNPGFTNDNQRTDFSENGMMLSSGYFPQIGYQRDVELSDDSTRRRHGLAAPRRLPPPQDTAARANNAVSSDADWATFHVTVGTSADQLAIFPGRLQRSWVEGPRRYFEYRSEAPMLNLYQIVSGRYTIARSRWKNVDLEIYYHRGHEFNLASMMLGMKKALAYCTSEYGPYQFKELRIIEFPRYATYADSLPATIPYSEGVGFTTRYDAKDPGAYDEAFYVTAHEVAHQWWGHQVAPAMTQGAGIIESLAQYTALMVMRRQFGQPAMRNFLRHELNKYLDGRGLERNEEEPLYRVEDQGYIFYSKGGQVMYTLAEDVGEQRINRALAAFIRAYKFHGPPYPTTLQLLSYLRAATPARYAYIYDDDFTHITLYDLRTVSASYRPGSHGNYLVTVTVQADKVRADGKGEEWPAGLHDWVQIGAQDGDGKYLYLRNELLTAARTAFTFSVDERPEKAGIDPLDMLINRTADQNVIPVSLSRPGSPLGVTPRARPMSIER